MKRKHLVVMKIGGSLLTDKTKKLTVDHVALENFAENLASVLDEAQGFDLLLGNGVGSFGHHTAHEYGLREGATTPEQFYGAAVTHNHVRRLNLLLADALTAKNLSVFSLSPGDALHANHKKVDDANLSTTQALLENGVIPLLHGDVIADSSRGISIFSTETSLFWCAQQLRQSYETITVITIVNTGGVLNAKNQIIPVLERNTEIIVMKPDKSHRDVTDGIVGKVQSCRAAADWANSVYIIGNTTSDIIDAIKHKTAGTKVL